jgi:hypothetical protein
MRIVGCVLGVLGLLILLYGGITYDRKRTILDLGSIKATATEQHKMPISPILGGFALLGGVLLILAPRKRAAA